MREFVGSCGVQRQSGECSQLASEEHPLRWSRCVHNHFTHGCVNVCSCCCAAGILKQLKQKEGLQGPLDVDIWDQGIRAGLGLLVVARGDNSCSCRCTSGSCAPAAAPQQPSTLHSVLAALVLAPTSRHPLEAAALLVCCGLTTAQVMLWGPGMVTSWQQCCSPQQTRASSCSSWQSAAPARLTCC